MAVINVNVMSVTKIRDSQTDIGPTISNFCWSWTGPMFVLKLSKIALVLVRSVMVRGSLAKIMTIRSREATNMVMTVLTSMNVTLDTTLVTSMPIVETLTDHMIANAK